MLSNPPLRSRSRRRTLALEPLEARQLLTVDLVPIAPGSTVWEMVPYTAGFGVTEAPTYGTYGLDNNMPPDGIADFPTLPVTGSTKIPVLLVDWSDFDPRTNLSNPLNPNSTFPDYQPTTPGELSAQLNGPNGVGAYFREISGGQLDVTFEVHPWIRSGQATYLQNRSAYESVVNGNLSTQVRDHALDVLRSAVVDLGVDFTQYDADENRVIDGFVIVYEGHPGSLSGTNMRWVKSNSGFFANVATLVDSTDPNYHLFEQQNIGLDRYNNLPENASTGTWAHELGHLLLGFHDYYGSDQHSLDPAERFRVGLSNYALSGSTGQPIPFHAAAVEKWMFGHWLDPVDVTQSGSYQVDTHDLKGPNYDDGKQYLLRIPVDGDPHHFLTIENRHFKHEDDGGSFFNSESGTRGDHPDGGLLIVEVKQETSTWYSPGQNTTAYSDGINLVLSNDFPEGTRLSGRGALQRGDMAALRYDDWGVIINRISQPGDRVTFDVDIETGITAADWQNWKDPLDVNADGHVSPLDALTVINEVNEVGSYRLPELGAYKQPHTFFDVNGDGHISAIDALNVINHINAGGGSGEGEGSAVDHLLGVVDFARLDGLDVWQGEQWVQLQASRSGTLTVEALFDHADGDINLAIYADGQYFSPTASSSSATDNERIDLEATAGDEFLVRITGANEDVDLVLANLLTVSGSTATVGGTSGADTYSLIGASSLTVNGVSYALSGVSQLNVDGGAGHDSLSFAGSSASERVYMYPASVAISGGGYQVSGSNLETKSATSGGGYDYVYQYDGSSNDTYTARPNYSRLSGPGFANTATGFYGSYGYATSGGYDQAYYYDSAGNDTLYYSKTYTYLLGSGFFNYGTGFDYSNVQSTAGGYDRGYFYDSSGTDYLYGRSNYLYAYGSGYFYYVLGFDSLTAYGYSGGYNQSNVRNTDYYFATYGGWTTV